MTLHLVPTPEAERRQKLSVGCCPVDDCPGILHALVSFPFVEWLRAVAVDGGTIECAFTDPAALDLSGVEVGMPPKLAQMLITCGCPPDGTVLDPFAGSGTTLEAALGLGRSGAGIDIDARNVALAQDRLGMFPLEVIDHLTAESVA